MSDLETLVFLMAWLLFNLFLVVLLVRVGLTLSGVIQTGSFDGVPVAIEFRRRLIWSSHFAIHLGATVVQAVGALVLIQIGAHVDDTKVQNLAYLCASVAGVLAIAWPFAAFEWMRYQVALLRKEEELRDA